MRKDLIVPEEGEENAIEGIATRVVTVPFTPLLERMTKDKPQLLPGLMKLQESLGCQNFQKYINTIHNINLSDNRMLIVADNEFHRTMLEKECLEKIMAAFQVVNVRIVAQG